MLSQFQLPLLRYLSRNSFKTKLNYYLLKPQELAAAESTSKEKESFSSQTMHKKVLDKGKPDDILPSIKGIKVSSKVTKASSLNSNVKYERNHCHLYLCQECSTSKGRKLD
jgi:hypothetical protein